MRYVGKRRGLTPAGVKIEVAVRDWLAAWDDLLCQRLRTCTVCGGPGPEASVGVWDLAGGGSVAFMACVRCQPRPDRHAALRTTLEARYAVAKI
jgi:hypothetical protein